MTEEEWLAATDLRPVIEFLVGKASRRKGRLIGCGYLRVIWPKLSGKEGSQEAVHAAERFADGEASDAELAGARRLAEQTAEQWSDPALAEPVWQAVQTVAEDDYDFLNGLLSELDASVGEAELVSSQSGNALRGRITTRHQLYGNILRDIFPFRPITLSPSYLTPTVLSLAQGIYEDRAFDRMPILADALQDSGCDNEDILNHCRGTGPHVRGCFVVDLILGKE
ncbi:hypothetical protein [Fimbriiglobus ruber]|uniref:hypothetical protein n=1 Tax=Fimbriiglobus ruber TaxID=1908690 RepID=UPI001EE6B2B7|nr:hypothetical protein [Fimbriiglobus ruber]